MANLFISWNTPNIASVSSQEVQYKKDIDTNWIVASTLPANANNYTITNVVPNTLYNVRIIAICNFGGPTSSSIITTIGLICPTVNITSSSTEIDYSFNNIGGDTTEYIVDLLDSNNLVIFSNQHNPSPVISGMFNVLPAQTYKIRVTTKIGTSYTKVCNAQNVVIPGFNFRWIIDTTVSYCEEINIYYNVEYSEEFLNETCEPGFTPQPYIYTVPAGKYSAGTQLDANNLALLDIEENGQEEANEFGECIEEGQPFKWIIDPTGNYCEQDDDPEPEPEPNEPPFEVTQFRSSNTDGSIISTAFTSYSDRVYTTKIELFGNGLSFIDGSIEVEPILDSNNDKISNPLFVDVNNNPKQSINKAYYTPGSGYSTQNVYSTILIGNVINTPNPPEPDTGKSHILHNASIDYRKFFTDFPDISTLYFRKTFTKKQGSAYTRAAEMFVLRNGQLAANNETATGIIGSATRVNTYPALNFDNGIIIQGKVVKNSMTDFDIFYDTETI